MSKKIEKIVADLFEELANGLEGGQFGVRPKIGLTGLDSEHGEENALQAACAAAKQGVSVLLFGTKEAEQIQTIHAETPQDAQDQMEKAFEEGSIDAAVTMHYPFPIGVSTVGRVTTPAKGKEMFIANTTGTSDTDKVSALVKNTIYGIAAAKACGVKEPTVGLLNIDGARKAEMALRRLQESGYPIHFAESSRADGGCILRGNDVLMGTADVLVTDSLTGNVLIKLLSAFQTGGNYEAVGYGYGPGLGEGYNRLVMIVSRASGAAVVRNAILYAAELLKGDVFRCRDEELSLARKAGLDKILGECKEEIAPKQQEAIEMPPKEVVTAQIPGIEIMDLEDGVQLLWKNKIYAESGMGCTGPVILISEQNAAKAKEILIEGGFIGA